MQLTRSFAAATLALGLVSPAMAQMSPDDLRVAYDAAATQRNRAMTQGATEQIELVVAMQRAAQADRARLDAVLMEWAETSLAAYDARTMMPEPPK